MFLHRQVVYVTVPLCLLFSATKDKLFAFSDVECLGTRVSAPTMQVSDDYFEDLTVEDVRQIMFSYANFTVSA